MLEKRKACCLVANASLSTSELIWPISRLKSSEMFKNTFLAKSSWSQWVRWPLHKNSALKILPWCIANDTQCFMYAYGLSQHINQICNTPASLSKIEIWKDLHELDNVTRTISNKDSWQKRKPSLQGHASWTTSNLVPVNKWSKLHCNPNPD